MVLWPVLNISFSSLWDLQVSKEWTSDLGIFTVYSFTRICCNMLFFRICSMHPEEYGWFFFFFFFLPLNYIDFHSPSSMTNKSLSSFNLTKLDNQFQIPSFKGLFLGITSLACSFYFVFMSLINLSRPKYYIVDHINSHITQHSWSCIIFLLITPSNTNLNVNIYVVILLKKKVYEKYTYIYIYVYIQTHTHTHTYIYIYIYIWIIPSYLKMT